MNENSTFPGIGHVALTVRSLRVSRPWYQRLVGADPVLDEATDGGFHHTVFMIGSTLIGSTNTRPQPTTPSPNDMSGSITLPSAARTGLPSLPGPTDSTNSGSTTEASWTPTTAQA